MEKGALQRSGVVLNCTNQSLRNPAQAGDWKKVDGKQIEDCSGKAAA